MLLQTAVGLCWVVVGKNSACISLRTTPKANDPGPTTKIVSMSLGLYVSVPFCRTKCTFCNFASDVFSRGVFQRYVERVCSDIQNAAATAEQLGGQFEPDIDSVYLGGGTPTVLDSHQLENLFVT